MTQALRVLAIGASSGILTHCLRQRVQEQVVHGVLVGRDPRKLQQIADDLRVRNPESSWRIETVDFEDANAIQALIDSVGVIDLAYVAHGALIEQSECEQDLTRTRASLAINALSPALFCEAIAHRLEQQGQGQLVIFGSVAGDRGRRSNYVYGASKGLLARYAQGLQHRFAATAIRVTLVKPGPTATAMTAHLATSTRLAPVDKVAACIEKGVRAGRPVVYAPPLWALIMLVIMHLPRFVFNRMKI